MTSFEKKRMEVELLQKAAEKFKNFDNNKVRAMNL